MKRTAIGSILAALALTLAACGGSTGLSDYAEEVEGLVDVMNSTIDDAVREFEASPITVEGTRDYLARRVDARRVFVAALGALDPPESVAEFHDAALDLVSRLTVAEAALAERAEDTETVEEIAAIWDGPEGRAFRDLDSEAIEFCRAAEAHLEGTEQAAGLEGMPFIPGEMQEVAVVVFRCSAEERGLTPGE